MDLHPSISVSAFAAAYLCATLLVGWPGAVLLVSAGFFANEAVLRRRIATTAGALAAP